MSNARAAMLPNIESVYQRLFELTSDHCKRTCTRLGSCCSPEYCEITIQYASDLHHVTLVPTGNKLPLLGADGVCTAAPYLRPMCTAHSCDIANLGAFKGEPKLTEAYYKLRDVASELEVSLYQSPSAQLAEK